MQVGCLKYPDASTISSQLLDLITPPWLAQPHHPAWWVPTQAPITLTVEWKEGRGRGGKYLKLAQRHTLAHKTHDMQGDGKLHRACMLTNTTSLTHSQASVCSFQWPNRSYRMWRPTKPTKELTKLSSNYIFWFLWSWKYKYVYTLSWFPWKSYPL